MTTTQRLEVAGDCQFWPPYRFKLYDTCHNDCAECTDDDDCQMCDACGTPE